MFFYDEFGEPETLENPMFVGRDGKPDPLIYSRMVCVPGGRVLDPRSGPVVVQAVCCGLLFTAVSILKNTL